MGAEGGSYDEVNDDDSDEQQWDNPADILFQFQHEMPTFPLSQGTRTDGSRVTSINQLQTAYVEAGYAGRWRHIRALSVQGIHWA